MAHPDPRQRVSHLQALRQPRAQQRRPRSRRFPRAPLADRRSEVRWRSTTRASRYPSLGSPPRPSPSPTRWGADVILVILEIVGTVPHHHTSPPTSPSPADPGEIPAACCAPTHPTRNPAVFFRIHFLIYKPSNALDSSWSEVRVAGAPCAAGEKYRAMLSVSSTGTVRRRLLPSPTTGVSSPSRSRRICSSLFRRRLSPSAAPPRADAAAAAAARKRRKHPRIPRRRRRLRIRE